MKKLTLAGLKPERQDLLRELALMGVVDIQEDPELQLSVTEGAAARIEEQRQRISDLALRQGRLAELIAVSADLLHQKKPMFTTRRIVAPAELADAGQREHEIMKTAEQLEAGLRELSQLDGRLTAAESRRQALEPWKNLVFPESAFRSSQRLAMIVGTVPDDNALGEARERLDEQLESYALEVILRTDGGLAVAVLCLKEERMLAERLLHLAHFADFPRTDKSGDLAGQYAAVAAEIGKIQAQDKEVEARLQELAKAKPDFELLHDYYQVKQAETEAAVKLAETDHLFVLTGFVPALESERVIRHLRERFILAAEAEDPVNEDYPILLKNNPIVSPYESIVQTFSMPKPHSDVDPTPVMGLFYVLSFGLMLGDVGYGALLSIICGILVWKVKVEGNMRKMCQLLFQAGIVSMGFGLLFGGFFGNLLTEVTQGRVNFPTLWFNPMDDPIKMMIWSVIFGVAHIFAGLGLSVYKKIRNGETYEALTSVAPWFFIISGLGLMLLGVGIGQWLALGGAAVILLFASTARNPLKRIFSGLGSLYGVTGYFSDLLSYTRILALALCTSVIAMVVNMMAMLPGIKGVGFIGFLLIMLAGHTLNLALSGLSAYVHTTRLQYVEFFGKFYDGGGEVFRPLSIDTRFTRQRAAWDK